MMSSLIKHLEQVSVITDSELKEFVQMDDLSSI